MIDLQLAARMFAASPVGLALMRGTRCVFLNDAFAEATGRGKDALLAMEDLFHIAAPDQLGKLRERYAARMAGQPVPSSYEISVLDADGNRRELEFAARILDSEHTLVTVRPLGEAVRGRDLLLALSELQAKAQRERTVRGIVDVALKGLNAFGVCGGLVRIEDGHCRLVQYTLTGPLGELLQPIMSFWRAMPGGVPDASVPRIRAVIAEQRSLFIDDLSPMVREFLTSQLGWPPERIDRTLKELDRHQLVMTPLRVNEQPYGAVIVCGEGLRSADLAALSLFAQQLGAMIEVAQSLEALELQNRTLEAIHRVARRTESSVEALVAVLLPLIAVTTRSDEAAIFLTESNGEWLNRVGTTNPRAFGGRYTRLPVQRTATGTAVVNSAPRAFSVDEWPAATREEVRKEGYVQLAVIPLIVESRVAGVLNLTRCRDERYDDAQLRGADMLVSQVALQLERVRVNEAVRRSYEQLAAAQAELVKRERLAALGELSAVVAHEVRNPLAVIFNSLAGLRRSEMHGEAGTLLRIVNEEAERLNRMVSDLLDFARPHQAKKRGEQLEPLLAEALDSARRVFPGSRVKFTLSVAADLGEVPMDAPLFRQALMNLIVNALQAMPEGGEVRVQAGRAERNGKPVAKIDVSDDGPGISSGDAERVFQPFFTTRATGTGLGLAVVKRIVEAHGAELGLDSAAGKGATFSIWLPL